MITIMTAITIRRWIKTAANVAEETQKPKHEQDNNYCPEHGVPFD